MNVVYRVIGSLILFAAVFAAGQTRSPARDSSGNDLLSCSPAPCVFAPTQASQGPNQNWNSPIAANPTNPASLILGSNDYNCGARGVESVGFYTSEDGGSNWTQLCMSSVFYQGQFYAPVTDPTLGYDQNGVAYIAGNYGPFEAFEKSSDGVNWTSAAPAVIQRDYVPLYCQLGVDRGPSSPHLNAVYISCAVGTSRPPFVQQVAVAHSYDGGATWQQVAVTPPTNTAENSNTSITIGRDGTVYLTWMYSLGGQSNYIVSSKSQNGGKTWSKPTLIMPVALIYPLPNTENVFIPDTPAIAIDNSTGSHAGNLYVVLYNWTGTFMQVQVVRSANGGATWSKPVPVAPGEIHDQFLPWIAVSPTGLVGVSWLDRRNDPNNIDYQAFGAISRDGGMSFQPNAQLTQAFSDPSKGVGDYIGATWNGPNYFLAAWMDNSQTMYLQDFVGGIRLK